MITEEMLAAAASEVSDAMVNSVPACPHQFSAAFEGKLRSLIRRTEHPVQSRLRQAAAVLVVLLTALAALYLASPTVRAAVNGWIRTTFGSYFQYYTEDTTPPDVQYNYRLPEEFDGYTLVTEVDRGTGKFYIYSNEEGQMLSFEYVYGSTDSSLFLMDMENHQYLNGYVSYLPADIYIAPTDDESSAIIWQLPSENVLFRIAAKENKDQLIVFAEKVEKVEKN